ncbi:Poly(ADP-ribose) glycohydrolase 1, partial [Mucuna pruriens]
MSNCKPVDSPMDSNMKLMVKHDEPYSDAERYRILVGKLIYITITRPPDISFAVGVQSSVSLDIPRRYLDWVYYMRIRKTPIYQVIMMLIEQDLPLIDDLLQKQNTVARSSAKAEYRAMPSATCELIWVKQLIQELKFADLQPMKLYCDNQAALYIAFNPVFHERTKHIKIDCHFVWEKLLAKEISAKFVNSSNQLVDISTKSLRGPQIQELIAALLVCSLFCLFPVNDRYAKHLPMINFDELSLYDDYSRKQENKIWCIVHYFQRISSDMPKGLVSFERKVLPFENDSIHISYPDANFWSTSAGPLCKFEVHSSGLIEGQSSGAIEVDFANKYLGGGALGRGCVQEEIRFMVSPELIAGMLFLPAMAENEAIEIVGVERFSSYTGYASSFQFSGDYLDERDVDTLGRRKTRIVAIDALCSPGMRQYRANFLLRQGFQWRKAKILPYKHAIAAYSATVVGLPLQIAYGRGVEKHHFDAGTSTSMETSEGKNSNHEIKNPQNDYHRMDLANNIGVATGNWGCGAFGGNPEVKTIIQWLAASQSDTIMFLSIAKEIWDVIEKTYSKAKDAAQCAEDAVVLKEFIEQDRVYDFLVGLNPEFDQVRIQILGKSEVPSFNKVVAILRSKESSRYLMLGSLVVESSAMFAEKSKDGQPKKTDVWCTYCNKPPHT